ncbi:hypothetical protein V3C99_000574, partial [Haemonchus contortus]
RKSHRWGAKSSSDGKFRKFHEIGRFGKKLSMPGYEPESLERHRPTMTLSHLPP